MESFLFRKICCGLFSLCVLFGIGCTSDDEGGETPSNDNEISINVDPTLAVPDGSDLLLWSLMDRGDGDNGYQFPTETVSGSNFTYSLPLSPTIESMLRLRDVEEEVVGNIGVYYMNIVDDTYEATVGIETNPNLTGLLEATHAGLDDQAIVFKDAACAAKGRAKDRAAAAKTVLKDAIS